MEFWMESVLALISSILLLGLDPPSLAPFDQFPHSTLPIQKLDAEDLLQISVAFEKVVPGHRRRSSSRAATHHVTYP